MALLLVLLLICITLSLSYAAVRSQFTGVMIQRNADRRASARQAAMTGLTIAMKKMHTGTWAGPESTLADSLGGDQSFQVTYSVGDASLGSGHPDYEDYPYRVTLLSTGYAADPDNPAIASTYQIRAVVRLVPRACPEEPSDWDAMQQYTLYQSKKETFEIDVPCRLEGPVRIQGKLELAKNYPNDNNAWLRYLGDLNAMRQAGLPDYRPFSGQVDLEITAQTGSDLSALTNELAVIISDTPVNEAGLDWVKPISLASYRIYQGGPVYNIPVVSDTLENVSLGPDPLTNPLGIYYRDSSITIRNNVTIRGSLFCKDDLKIEGTNVHFESVELPALHGSQSTLRLPAASCRNFTVKASAGGSLTGLLAVFDAFQIDKSPDTVAFAVTGRLITRKFFIKERQPWETQNWSDLYSAFEAQLALGPPLAVPFFPVWLDNAAGLDPKPLLTVKPDPTEVRYHWHKLGDQIFLSHPDDAGLRWDLVEWTENP